jgi:hypothetical protein
MTSIYTGIALRLGIAIGVLNFFAFVLGASALGGDALNGTVVNGHYFVSNHGHLTEVSAQAFHYSAWHFKSIFATHALAAFCVFLLQKRKSLLDAGHQFQVG